MSRGQTIIAEEVILQLPLSSPLLVCLGQVQEELLEVQNPATSWDFKPILGLWAPASALLKLEKSKSRVSERIENDQLTIQSMQKGMKHLGSVGVEESQGVTAGAIRANDGLNIWSSYHGPLWSMECHIYEQTHTGNTIPHPGVSRRPSLCSCPYNYKRVRLGYVERRFLLHLRIFWNGHLYFNDISELLNNVKESWIELGIKASKLRSAWILPGKT